MVALALGAALMVACSEDADLKDTRPVDTGGGDQSDAEVEVLPDTGATIDDSGDDSAPVEDASMTDASPDDTGSSPSETGAVDSGVVDSAIVDSVALDTGPLVDTGASLDTGSELDSSIADTGTVVDSGTIDSTIADTGAPSDSFVVDSELDTAFDSAELDTSLMPDTEIDSSIDMDSAVTDTGEPDTEPALDSGTLPDTSAEAMFAPSIPALPGWSPARAHAIVIDGVNDFAEDEALPTTTPGVKLFVSWDALHLYVGYAGVASSRTFSLYFDTAPGGARATELLGTQRALFTDSFSADRALHVGETGQALRQWSEQGWMTLPARVDVARAGAFVELRIPIALLGGSRRFGMTAFVRDTAREELAAGVGIPSFVDGYSPAGAPKTLARWFDADRESPLPPSARERLRL